LHQTDNHYELFIYFIMKKLLILCGLVAACLCLAQTASAQYAGPIVRKGVNLVDRNGNVIPDGALMDIVGADVYSKTVVGARKQMKAGRALIWSGAAGMLVGTAGMVAGTVLIANNAHIGSNGKMVYDNEDKAAAGAGIYLAGGLLLGAGAIALDAGIPLAIIGKKRLNWVADHTNGVVSYNIGATPNGVGIALNF
jgi:hypothetical protein